MSKLVCEMCGLQFPAEAITCPHCKGIMGGFLSRPIGHYPDMKKVAVSTVKALEHRWAFNPFAAGWRLVDVLGRALLILVLVWLGFQVNGAANERYASTVANLDSHRKLASGLQDVGDSVVRGVAYEYSSLTESTGDLVEALRWNATLFLLVILAMVGLLATSGIASYRQFKELNKVKATLRFLCTEEGRAFVGGILVDLAADRAPPAEPVPPEPPADTAPPEPPADPTPGDGGA